MDRHTAQRAAAVRCDPHLVRRAPDQVLAIGRTPGVVAAEREPVARPRDRQRIVQRNRLKNGAQLVIAVGARAEDAQRQVNLCERPDEHASVRRE
jgi:hypothetical protein